MTDGGVVAGKNSERNPWKLEHHNNNNSARKTAIANLSLLDDEFVQNVENDISIFLKQRHNGVLLFPPVNNFRRFLIHQTCENFRQQYDLFTFSVGQGPFRRTVVCFKNQLLDPNKFTDTAAAANFETRKQSPVKSWRSGERRIEAPPSNLFCTSASSFISRRNIVSPGAAKMGVEKGLNDAARLIKTNSVDLYRPPALRNHNSETFGLNGGSGGGGGGVTATNATTTASGATAVSSAFTTTSSSSSSSSSSPPSSSSSSSSTTTNTSISCNNSPTHAANENDDDDVAANHCFDNSVTSTKNAAGAGITIADPTAAAAALTNGQQSRQQQAIAAATRRERRPDRAVYVPRARRSQTTPPTATTTNTNTQLQQAATSIITTTTTTTSTTASNQQQQQQLPITSDPTALVSVATATSAKTDELLCKSTISSSRKSKSSASSASSNNKERRERVKKATTTTAAKSNKFSETELEAEQTLEQQPPPPPEAPAVILIASPTKNHVENSQALILSTNCDSVVVGEQPQEQQLQLGEVVAAVTADDAPGNCIVPEPIAAHIIATNAMNSANSVAAAVVSNGVVISSGKKLIRSSSVASPTNLLIEDVVVVASSEVNARRSSQHTPKCDIDAQELQRASKEINRSNRRIIKQTFVSDVLEIPEKIYTKVNAARSPPPIQFPPSRSNVVDSATEEDEDDEVEEDDWETMFDESGECLDPKIIQELTASVGKVKIELPKMDYSAYLTKQSILNEEEFPHVLEVSNFPVEFKNQDLLMVFSQYKESGFDIKWVDDTHALAVFSSSQIAAEVLTMGHPFVVLKPLAEATVESRLKAKKCATSLQPYRPRPATCAALARRLVTGALGVRLKTAAVERENEIRVLREAKERKLLAAKQRDEVWES